MNPIIALSELRFRWRAQGPETLRIDALEVAAGERLFVEGPSGSGKSTLLGLLAGVNQPQQGRIQVLGERLDQLSPTARDRFRADHIGYLFQLFNLIPYLGILDNVTLPARFSRHRRARALARSPSLVAEAKRLLTHLDLDQRALARQAVSELSIGQQQRVAAARALFGSPALLIADEPTSSLDADRRRAFLELLFAECAETGSTLIFVSHDASLEGLFDRTLRLPELNQATDRGGPAARLRAAPVAQAQAAQAPADQAPAAQTPAAQAPAAQAPAAQAPAPRASAALTATQPLDRQPPAP